MLPNRALYHDRLEHLIALGRRAKTPFAVAIIDLDHFKEINDVKGHQTGDMVLQTMAQRLTKALRQSDTVARMGGDEFALLLPPVGDEATARMTAERIIGAMCTPMEIAGETLDVGASLGMALFPQHGEQAELLMRRADTAMYQAKFTKSGFCLYRAELEQLSQERHALQGELRRAIEEQELVLHYQPKVDFETNRLNGVEALVRWQHPKHGLMFPDQFIPMAEKTGLIKHLTTTVMRMALRQCVEWRRNGVILNMAVNIASQNLMEDDFPKRVGEILSETQAHPSWLELEITETGVMTNPVLAAETIRQLSTMGIQISIDDFGTGYSSMAYIAKLFVAKIKIDKSFVMDMTKNSTDAVIVRAAIDLGHNLGLKVVAEGVEDQATWEQLKALGCDVAQGYHLTRPVAADQLIEWIRKSPWSLEEGGGHKEEKPVATI
jgi:diguanylate cyclase (GGDEF)-like protein